MVTRPEGSSSRSLYPFSFRVAPGDERFSLVLTNDFSRAIASREWKRRTGGEDEELEIFRAEKYFSGAMDGGEVVLSPFKVSPEKELTFSPGRVTPSATPSVFFESWGTPSGSKKLLRVSLWSCFGSLPDGTFRENGFLCNEKTSRWKTDKPGGAFRHMTAIHFAPPSDLIKRKTTRTFKLAMADPEVDVFSESSSDLFELETVSTSTHAFGGTGGAPSEASIEWSVVTAKASDFSSAPEGQRRFSTVATRRRHQRSGGLGCRGRKAINVAANVHRTPAKSGPEEWRWRGRVGALASSMDLRQARWATS
ncbi:unnamed protein product [Spirodela intermedia]|uniref:Uncharacterized protein n=1 Tax=Spirodela intermedia TaxID=51605 RepID=A0A7I8J4J7_SPIIN|nr:unnamed protein product [Spirodela intermedia]CAA6665166.1 unnamed protein product [Spirodela intermedia]